MIIVIGKKDKALIADAQAYVRQCGEQWLKDKPWLGDKGNNERIAKDCRKIADRLLRTIGIKVESV